MDNLRDTMVSRGIGINNFSLNIIYYVFSKFLIKYYFNQIFFPKNIYRFFEFE
jgi:hypothetical protein